MTYEELVSEVENYGCGDVIDTKKALLFNANRALSDLYFHIPVIKCLKFYSRGYKPIIYHREIVYDGSSPITIYTTGKSYTMHVMGRGNYTVKDGSMINAYQFDTGRETKIIRGFISDGGYIRFWGGFSFTIYNLAIYNDIFSPEVEDIPDGTGKIVYDMRRICPDFLSFSTLPTDADGKVIKGCRIFDGRIEVDSDYIGEVNVNYRRIPKKILGIEKEDIDDPDEIIDVSEEHIPMFMYLIWYHYWCGTDDTRMKHYKDKFTDLLSIYNNNLMTNDRSYVDVNGWA